MIFLRGPLECDKQWSSFFCVCVAFFFFFNNKAVMSSWTAFVVSALYTLSMMSFLSKTLSLSLRPS